MSIKFTGAVLLPANSGFLVDPTASSEAIYYSISGTPSVGEAGILNFTVTRTKTGVAETVSYSLSGTATSGVDYTAPSGSVAFLTSDTTKTISITTLSDALIEGSETLVVTLTTTNAGGIIETASASGTITDSTILSTLNASDVGTGSFGGTLSNISGQLRSVITNGGARFGNVRAFGGKASGKWYFEVQTVGIDGQLGLATAAVGLNQNTFFASGTAVVGVIGGPIGVNGSTVVGNQAITPANKTTAVAYDADNDKFWIGCGNNDGGSFAWIGGGNPASNTGGYSFNPGVAVYPLLSPYQGSGTTEMRFNAGQDTFKFTKPSGFNNWTA